MTKPRPFTDCPNGCASREDGRVCQRCISRRRSEDRIDQEIAAKFDPLATPELPFGQKEHPHGERTDSRRRKPRR